MKTIQVSALMTCVLLLAGVTNAQTVTVQHIMDYRDNGLFDGTWFVEPGQILDHQPFCRGSNQDWGWTHDVANMVPNGATGIASATLTIVAWKVDVEAGEDDVIYALPEEPAITTGIPGIGTELGLLASYFESPISVSWWGDGQVVNYADLWSVTTFELPANVIDDLWANGQVYFYIDIDQTNWDGMRVTVKSAVLRINYFAPEAPELPVTNVHRFWSPLLGGHFYTTNETEAEILITDYSYVWTYEGIAYRTLTDGRDAAAMPVYRFWSPVLGSHFYTISDYEAEWLLANYADIWTYEGPVFYAYPPDYQPAETYPVYRFWSNVLGRHFYTMDEAEMLWLVANYPDVWTYETIAWYAFLP